MAGETRFLPPEDGLLDLLAKPYGSARLDETREAAAACLKLQAADSLLARRSRRTALTSA